MPDDITSKNVMMFMTCGIKDGNNFYSKLFLEESLFDKWTHRQRINILWRGIKKDGGIDACQKMRKKEWNQFLLISVKS